MSSKYARSFASKTSDWSTAQYLKFEKERTRPSRDLLAQVPLADAEHVVDLGCGPGNSTQVLRDRYPLAKIEGVDSSPAMLEKARKILPDINFYQEDLTTYRAPQTADLLFSNAVFQWLPADERLPTIRRLMQTQAAGSLFAFQVPDNFTEPSHFEMRATAENGPWADTLKQLSPSRGLMPTAQAIYDAIKPICSEVDLWHSHYYHVLEDHEAVVEWVKGTGLRPFLDPLPTEQQEGFLKEYLDRIRKVYPSSADGSVILKYPRLFMVAVRS